MKNGFNSFLQSLKYLLLNCAISLFNIMTLEWGVQKVYSDLPQGVSRLDRLPFPGNWCAVILLPDWVGYNFLGTSVVILPPDWIGYNFLQTGGL